MTDKGFPITQRGRVGLEVSAFKIGVANSDYYSAAYVAATALSARARLTGGLFADLRFASAAFLYPGNLMGGVDYVATVAKTTWLTFGGALGVPLARASFGSSILYYGMTNAMWNLHELTPNTVPVRFDLNAEHYIGDFGMRLELNPVVYLPVDQSGADPQFVFQHAFEAQYGHSLGAGLRLQGVANTFQSDAYQAAVELFVVLRRDIGFARLGLLKTLDEDSGSVYDEAWGMRLSAGFHLD